MILDKLFTELNFYQCGISNGLKTIWRGQHALIIMFRTVIFIIANVKFCCSNGKLQTKTIYANNLLSLNNLEKLPLATINSLN